VNEVAVNEVVVVEMVPVAEGRDPGAFSRRRARIHRLLAVLPPLLLLVLWEVAGRAGVLDRRIFPPPSRIWDDLVRLAASGDLLRHTWATTVLIVVGFLAGALVAVPLGLVIGRAAWMRALLNTTVAGLYTVPKLAVFPLLLLAFGIGNTAKVVLIAITSGLIVLMSTIDAARDFPASYTDAAITCGSGRLRTLVEVVIPGIAAPIFTSLRLAIGTAVLITIATEFLAANEGLGYLIWTSWSLFQPGPMYVGIVASALLGVLLVGLVGLVERVVTPWSRPRGRRRLGLLRRTAGAPRPRLVEGA
jgi:ABC-type nitrate/sulfonate/bicarbonate transport system permease component